MKHPTRRQFIQSSLILASWSVMPSAFGSSRNKALLSFSTLGCPDWDFKQVVDFAAAHDYQGIELRGIKRQLDLLQCEEFKSPENRKATLRMMKDKGLKFVDLGSSANLHFPEGTERTKNMDEARRFIDLAQEIGCPFIRVFPNDFPKGTDKNETIDLMAGGLLMLAQYAKDSDVSVLIESHGDLVHTDDLEKVLKAAEHPHAGMIWDVVNMWSITKEPVAQAFERLKKYIRHTHIKDAKVSGSDDIQYVFLGKGDVPIFEAIDLLAKNNYKGYYSFEWEKMWHPELPSPELALTDYSQTMRKHFS
ncbi:MAG: sugar phosphate isomerase/epimerase [Bacteroidetes bacterium]|jgi:sugar phosphate isomerase/epimerase|nr:sugar phosphate isomerase/epimerase [Bacteroidota bacterium]